MSVELSKEHIEGILARSVKVEYCTVKFRYKYTVHAVSIVKCAVLYKLVHADDNFLRFISLSGMFNSAEEAVEYIANQPGVDEFL